MLLLRGGSLHCGDKSQPTCIFKDICFFPRPQASWLIFLEDDFVYKWVCCPGWINMVDFMSKILLDTDVQKSLMTPKVISSDLVLQ